MPHESTKEPTTFMRVGAALFGIIALHSLYLAVASWFEFQRSPLPVVKFFGISSTIKGVLCTVAGFLLFLRWRPLAFLLGHRPFHYANALAILMLTFAAGAPSLVRLTNRPYDLIGDGALVVLYYGYIPVSLALWIASAIAVGIVWRTEADIGRRPGFWVAALAAGPLICIWVLSSRILN